jgi:hypothetical protein
MRPCGYRFREGSGAEPSLLAGYGNEMRAGSDDRRFVFYFREHLKKSSALRDVGQRRTKGGGTPCRSLDTHNLDVVKIGVADFGP